MLAVSLRYVSPSVERRPHRFFLPASVGIRTADGCRQVIAAASSMRSTVPPTCFPTARMPCRTGTDIRKHRARGARFDASVPVAQVRNEGGRTSDRTADRNSAREASAFPSSGFVARKGSLIPSRFCCWLRTPIRHRGYGKITIIHRIIIITNCLSRRPTTIELTDDGKAPEIGPSVHIFTVFRTLGVRLRRFLVCYRVIGWDRHRGKRTAFLPVSSEGVSFYSDPRPVITNNLYDLCTVR